MPVKTRAELEFIFISLAIRRSDKNFDKRLNDNAIT